MGGQGSDRKKSLVELDTKGDWEFEWLRTCLEECRMFADAAAKTKEQLYALDWDNHAPASGTRRDNINVKNVLSDILGSKLKALPDISGEAANPKRQVFR